MTLLICGTKVGLGEKRNGFFEIAESQSELYRIPFIVTSGVNEGKTIAILGGTHGTEYASIEAVIRLMRELDPEKMSGTVIAVPVVNVPQFRMRTQFTSPIDGVNLNQVYPGDKNGSFTQRLAHQIFNEVVSKADALIDCHGGDLNEDLRGFVVASKGPDEGINKVSLEMASCYPCELVHVFPAESPGMSNSAQVIYGIPCIMPESGTPVPMREADVRFHVDGMLNVLKFFGVIEGKPQRRDQYISPERLRLRSEHNGIWYPQVILDQKVCKGDLIGVVSDLTGEELQPVKAPKAGIVSMMRSHYSVRKDEMLLIIST
jgi:predicted deacylase